MGRYKDDPLKKLMYVGIGLAPFRFEIPGDEGLALAELGIMETFSSKPSGCGDKDTHYVGTVNPAVDGFNGLGSYRPVFALVMK